MRRRLSIVALAVVLVTVAAGCRLIVPGQGRPVRGLTATGWFHTQQHGGRWWLVTPDGRPFYSHGVNHVTAAPNTDQATGRCPYCDTLAAKYPSLDAWRDATVRRLRDWGFNTIGAWSDWDRFTNRMPYTVNLSMAAGNDWFAPAFEEHARTEVERNVVPLRNDPNLVGWFLDNELRWGRDFRGEQTMLDLYLALPPGSPGRAVAEQHAGDPSGFLTALAERYFSVTTSAIRARDPHHLILGTRMISFLTPAEVVAVAGRYVDVLSVNHYDVVPGLIDGLNGIWGPFVPVDARLTRFHELSGKPIIVTEYSFRGADAGLPNEWPPIYLTAPDQTGRADLWQQKVEQLYTTPWIVGDHWFEWADQPPGGRFDGEDNNFGLVSNADETYEVLTSRMRAVHATAPDRQLDPRPRCGAWADGPGRLLWCLPG